MHIGYHLIVSVVVYGVYSIFVKQSVDPLLVLFAILGAALVDLDHVFVIITQTTEFTQDIRKKLCSRDFRGAIIQLMGKERKSIGKMYLHNFWFFGVAIVFSIMTLDWPGDNFKALLYFGVIPHLVLDVVDDLVVIHSLRNWFWANERSKARPSSKDRTDELVKVLDRLDENVEEFRKLLARYVYHLAASSTSLLESFLSTLIIRWHIARRIESYVRLCRVVLPWLRLQLYALDHITKSELKKRGENILQKYADIVNDLEKLSGSLAGHAMAYVSSTIVFLILMLATAFSGIVSIQMDPFERDMISVGIMGIIVVFLLFLDANLYKYVSITTELVEQNTTLMDLEVDLYFRASGLIQKKIYLSRSRLYFELGFFIFAFSLMTIIGTYINYILMFGSSPLFRSLALVITAQILLIPILFVKYARNLIKALESRVREPHRRKRKSRHDIEE